QSPAPAGQTQGKITEREYDSIGRLLKDKIANYGGAYTRYEYPVNNIRFTKGNAKAVYSP
ncbi:MAG: hypothetical protein ACT4O9_01555, partial [Blastocatellia bacterium]